MRTARSAATPTTSRLRHPNIAERRIRAMLVLLGVGHLALGIWQALYPGTFFRAFAAFGSPNDHYVRDIATMYLALGLVFLAAARRPSWRAPILLFAVLQYGFHLINHVIDVGNAHPRWIGPVDVAALAAVEALLIFLAGASRQAGQ